jgi:outer membrane protein assembly factor BamB
MVMFGDANGIPAVFFGDAKGIMYAVDANDGRLIWKSKPVEHPASMITATPRFYDGVIYQPISSNEEGLALRADYKCCTFRGSVVALDAGTGKTIWQGFTITQEPAPSREPQSAAVTVIPGLVFSGSVRRPSARLRDAER